MADTLNSFSTNVDCAVCIEWYNMNGLVNKNLKLKTSIVSLSRNEFRELYLLVNSKQIQHKFKLKSVSVFKKFMNEGKASIKFSESNVSVLISNAPAVQLAAFLKVLFIKLTSSKSSPKPTIRNKLLSVKAQTLQEVSPVNCKDVSRTSDKISNSVGVSKKRPGSGTDKVRETKKVCLSSIASMNNEQKAVLDAVLKKSNIFFTGSAGTGKSFVLRAIISSLPPDVTVATASTGAAASLIGGITLHSFAGIGTGEANYDRCFQLASRQMTAQNWRRCRHLIIDEISMVDGPFFQKIERIARDIRGNDRPFGGIQVIVCGDFLQLPPVSKATNRFCFTTETWDKCNFQYHYLKQVHRQSDPTFVNILNSIRIGKVTEEIKNALKGTATQDIESGGILATRLCSHTKEALTINQSKLEQLSGDVHLFEASDLPVGAGKYLDDCTPVSKSIVLKEGAQVMLLKNVNISKGLVNGARGIVEKFVNGDAVVKFMCGENYKVKCEKWQVKGANGVIYTRKQVPLKLAWAFSIHKSQGLTLDCVEMCLENMFEAGQAYVALSRAKSLTSLRVIGFQEKQVWADPLVLRFYSKFNMSQQLFIPLGNKRSSNFQWSGNN